jgi:YVTN family beta-propeller protein
LSYFARQIFGPFMHNCCLVIRHFFIAALATLGLLVSSATLAAPPILVLNSLSANVSVIDPVTYKEIKRVPVGKEPHHLYMTPDNRSVMVANAAGDSISFLDPNTGDVQRTLKGISDPYHLRFSPDMKWFVTAANRLNHVDIYRWENKNGEFQMQLVKRLPAGKTPSHIAIDSKSMTAYFTLQDSHELMAVDLATQKPLWTIPVVKRRQTCIWRRMTRRC